MADNQRDVQFIVRASDMGSKTFTDVAASVDKLTSALETQVKAAKAGDLSASELRDTLSQLQKAGDALIKQQGLVDLYKKLGEQLATTEGKANELRDAYAALNNAGGAEGFTKKQVDELAKLSKALDEAERRVQTTQASMKVQADKLSAAGLAADDLAGSQAAIVSTATAVGAAIVKVNESLTNYQANLRDVKAAGDALAQSQKTAAFQQTGTEARQAAAALDELTNSQRATATQTSSLAKSLLSILDPTAASIQTIDGLETRINGLAAQIGDARKPIGTYTEAINGLSQAQAALYAQARTVDQFQAQTKAVEQATTAYDAAKSKVLLYASAVEKAEAPDQALAASLKEAQTELRSTAAALDNEKAKLDALSASMAKASLGTDSLAVTEKRLQAAAQTAAEASAKINRAQSGANSPAGSFLGLRPYELQNLSYQLNDVFTQIASGTPIMQVAAQQGGQIAQIFPEAITAIIAFLPEILAVVAAFATLYETIKRATELQDNVRQFGAALTVSADGAKYSAQQLAAVTQALGDMGVKSADAKKAVMELAQAGLDPARLNEFAVAARNVSKVTGEDVPTAAAQLIKGFRGGYQAVADLDSQFNFLTSAERVHIRAMFESGDAAGARTLAFQKFNTVMEEAANKAQGPWSKAILDLTKDWKGFLDALANSAPVQGAINLLNGLADAIDRAHHTGQQIPGQGQGGAGTFRGGGVQFTGGVGAAATGAFAGLATGGIPAALAGAISGALSPRQPIITPDIDLLVRTVIGEALKGNVQGQQDVASVILNRSLQSGKSISDVITQPGQFQSMDEADTRRALMAIPQQSKAFQAALQAILPVLQNGSTVGNAVNFYSPSGQKVNVAQGKSKSLVPGFADPSKLVADRNGQQFFSGTFPGGPAAGSDGTQSTQAAQKIGQDMLTDLQRQIAAQNELNDAQRVNLAGLKVQEQFNAANADAASTQAAVQAAEAEERRKIQVERLQQFREVTQQETSLASEVTSAQDESLDQRLNTVKAKYQALFDQINILRKKGLQDDGQGHSLDELEKQAKAYQEIALQQAQMKFYEDQLATLEKQRSDAIAAINAKVAAGAETGSQAVSDIAKVQADLLPRIQATTDAATAFGNSIKGATPDPKLLSFLQTMATAPLTANAAGIKSQLADFQAMASSLQKQEQDRLKAINDLAGTGSITATEAFNQSKGVIDDLGPKLTKLASDALVFAKALNQSSPSPELQAFIAQMQGVVTEQGNPASTQGPLKQSANQQLSAQDQKLNDVLSQRSQIVESINTQEQQGDLTHQQAQDKLAATYAEFTPLIKAQVDELKNLATALHDAGVISDQTFEALQAKLDTVTTQTKFVSQNFTELRGTIVNSFTQGTVQAFDTVTTAIGNAIVGTGKWEDVLTSLGQAALQFGASFLKSIGDILIQMLALKAIQSLPGLNSLTNGLLGATGLGVSAASLGAAGGAVAAGGAAVSGGAIALTGAAAAVSAAAAAIGVSASALAAAGAAGAAGGAGGGLGGLASLAQTVVSVLHGGGTVGSVGGMSRVDMGHAWASAPRYHTGQPSVGLNANEQRAILLKGEEVLSNSDPRNIANIAAGRGRGKAPNAAAIKQRIIAVFDPKDIHSVMASSAGEEITLAHVKKNATTVSAMIGNSNRGRSTTR